MSLKEVLIIWIGLVLSAQLVLEETHGVGLSNKNVNTPTTQIAPSTKATYVLISKVNIKPA